MMLATPMAPTSRATAPRPGNRPLNRLELAGESVRAALEALAAAAPGWLATVIDSSWQRVYGQRIDNLRLPEAQAARDELGCWYEDGDFAAVYPVRGARRSWRW